MMEYSLVTLWHERNRYLPAVLAVAFSALLVVMQVGLLIGILSELGRPIERSRAEIWVGYPGVPSVDLGAPVPTAWQGRLASLPGVQRVDCYLRGLAFVGKSNGGVEVCTVIGAALDDGSLGAIVDLTPELRLRLSEFGTVVVNEGEVENVGFRGLNDTIEITGCRVRLVGTVPWVRGIAGAYLFCSLDTARQILRIPAHQTTFLLARCRRPEDIAAALEQLQPYTNLSAFRSEELVRRSVLHWLTKSKAGIALGCAALLGLIVGTVVTSQTLYAATVTSLRQYAVLEALGIPGRRMVLAVLAQSFWVGLLGMAVAAPAIAALVPLFGLLQAKIALPGWLLVSAAALTMIMALLSGVAALRSLYRIEPAALLR